MSATARRCFRCSGSAARSGRSTPSSSPATPAIPAGAGGRSTPAMIDEFVDGLEAIGALARCDGRSHRLSRQARNRRGRAAGARRGPRGRPASDLRLRSRDRRRRARRLCRRRRRANSSATGRCARADILTPNAFELGCLDGSRRRHRARPRRPRRAARARDRGRCSSPRSHLDDTPADALDMLASDGADLGACARRGCRSRSTAPAISSRRCSSIIGCDPRSRREALASAAASVYGVVAATAAAGRANSRSSRRRRNSCAPTQRFRAEPL